MSAAIDKRQSAHYTTRTEKPRRGKSIPSPASDELVKCLKCMANCLVLVTSADC